MPGLAFDALMHDTAEAFTNDLPTPLKYAIPAFKELEVKIEAAMARRFLFTYPLRPEIKVADLQMLGLEKVCIKADFSHWDCLDGIQFGHLVNKVDLSPMSPDEARAMFLQRFWQLDPRG